MASDGVSTEPTANANLFPGAEGGAMRLAGEKPGNHAIRDKKATIPILPSPTSAVGIADEQDGLESVQDAAV